MNEGFINAIRSFEGYSAEAKWDYAQFTNGFGSRARFAGEQIDEAEAHRRFAAEIAEARQFVDRHAQGWDDGTKAALTSLTFNAGTRWASSGLGRAVQDGDVDTVRSRFLEYTKAGGVDLPGLVRRRLEEVTWIGGHEGNANEVRSAGATAAELSARQDQGASADITGVAEPLGDLRLVGNDQVIPDGVSRDFGGPEARANALLLLLMQVELSAMRSRATNRDSA